MQGTPRKCCEEPSEAKFFVLFRSSSFESSLRNYDEARRRPLEEKHHRREFCHHNCSRPYDKHERIMHYAMVRQQEMLKSRERVREVSRSRSRNAIRRPSVMEPKAAK